MIIYVFSPQFFFVELYLHSARSPRFVNMFVNASATHWPTLSIMLIREHACGFPNTWLFGLNTEALAFDPAGDDKALVHLLGAIIFTRQCLGACA